MRIPIMCFALAILPAQTVAHAQVAAAPPAGSPEPVKVSGGVMAGRILSKGPVPDYARVPKGTPIGGAEVFKIVVAEDGTVESVQTIQCPEVWRAAVEAAVKQWRYRPYVVDGVPRRVETTVTLNVDFDGGIFLPEDAPEPIRVSGGVMAGNIIEKVAPVCPRAAMVEQRVSCRGVMAVVVGADGRVESVEWISGVQEMREAFVEAVKRWRYRPYLVDGVPRRIATTVSMDMSFGGG